MSRFVASGTNDEPTERDEAWLEAQKKIEATRQAKPKIGEQEGGKSLYETLQANKAAKQDAFEEAARLRNQFRSLDEDEVDFLDSVMESTRSKEAEVKKETREQLDAFRKQREEAEKAAQLEEGEQAPAAATETWSVGPRKRKKGREKEGIGGVKLRRISTAEREDEVAVNPVPNVAEKARGQKAASPTTPRAGTAVESGKAILKDDVPKAATTKATPPPVSALGLVAYSSDEDE